MILSDVAQAFLLMVYNVGYFLDKHKLAFSFYVYHYQINQRIYLAIRVSLPSIAEITPGTAQRQYVYPSEVHKKMVGKYHII